MLIQIGLKGVKGVVNKVFCGQCQELILDLGKVKMVIALRDSIVWFFFIGI